MNEHQDSTGLEFHQEIAEKVTLSSLHFILPSDRPLVPCLPDFFPLGQLRHGPDNHDNLAICRAVPVPVQSQVSLRGGLGCCRVTLGQPTVQRPTWPGRLPGSGFKLDFKFSIPGLLQSCSTSQLPKPALPPGQPGQSKI